MNKLIVIIVGAILLLLLVAFSTTYTVGYNEVAIKKTFGHADENSIVTEAGWHFRLPIFADRVEKYDKRLHVRESPLEPVQTQDGQLVQVRAFLLWRVQTEGDGPLQFSRSYASTEDAQQSLIDPLRSAMNALGQYTFNDLIGSESKLAEAEQKILAELEPMVARSGIEPVEVGISKTVLPTRTARAVLDRMRATRETLAEAVRHKGNAEAERIRNQAATLADKIRAFARTRAEEIRAEGNKAAAQYLEQMSQEEDLAVFLAWLDTLEAALSKHVTIVIPTHLAPFHLMNTQTALDGNGIPQPEMKLAGPADAPGKRVDADGAVSADESDEPAPTENGEASESSDETTVADKGEE